MKIVADENIPFVKECFSSIGEVYTCPAAAITPDTIADADILLVRSVTKTDTKLLADSNVRFVGTATIGTEHVDIDYLNQAGIAFASAPGSNANSVAEYIVAALLSVARKYKFTIEDKSIGIVGVGNVGSKVAVKTAALGMNVKLNDPPLQRKTQDKKYLPLESLFDCDFITLHTPLTFDCLDKTYHLADEDFFKRLKPGAGFINTSRGGVCDTDALKNEIAQKHIGPVVLDVWENEPDIDNELLLKVDLSTPHIAGYSLDGKVNGMIMIYNALCRHLDIEPEFTLEDFLPKPDLPEIQIDTNKPDTQTALHDTVQQVYNINRDDFNTREILVVPQPQRGAFFTGLRKDYPVRREFQNTRVVIEPENNQLKDTLQGIGFKV